MLPFRNWYLTLQPITDNSSGTRRTEAIPFPSSVFPCRRKNGTATKRQLQSPTTASSNLFSPLPKPRAVSPLSLSLPPLWQSATEVWLPSTHHHQILQPPPQVGYPARQEGEHPFPHGRREDGRLQALCPGRGPHPSQSQNSQRPQQWRLGWENLVGWRPNSIRSFMRQQVCQKSQICVRFCRLDYLLCPEES
jgi:hypothetical protein